MQCYIEHGYPLPEGFTTEMYKDLSFTIFVFFRHLYFSSEKVLCEFIIKVKEFRQEEY
jgi:hypothetical protein